MKREEKDIQRALKCGDQNDINRSIDFVYRNYYGMIEKLVKENGGNVSDVDDLFQDSLETLYRNFQRGLFKAESSVKTYFYAIARNIWLGQIRKNKYTQRLDIEIIDEEMHPSESLESDENATGNHQLVARLVNEMPDGCKNILTDFYYRYLSVEAIQEKYKLASKQVAKTKKYRCLKNLIDAFKSHKPLLEPI